MTERPTDQPRPAADPALPTPTVTRANRFHLSLVWLVPIVAILLGASLLLRNYLETGPRIQIEFNTAEGLEEGKTEVRFKEVVVGRVEKVSLRDDRKRVVATVQLDRSAASMAVEDTQFWVVRPRIGTAGISGLGTLFSGVYIGVDAGVSDVSRRRFVGLESPPFILRGEPGASFALVADDLGSLDVGSPVYYRRAKVGRVVGHSLDPKQDELTVKIFIDAPYHQLVTPQTRFWNASGVDLTLNANGLTLDTQTLSSVLAGGIAFERLPTALPEPPAADGSRFKLFNDRKAALAPPDGEPVQARMVFDHSVRGLVIGAPVDFLGVEIGKVKTIELMRDVRRRRFPVEVTVDLFPLRLGKLRDALLGPADALPPPPAGAVIGDVEGRDNSTRAVQKLVAQGLKAQMRTGNLLTGQLYIALDFFRDGSTATGADGRQKTAAVSGKRKTREQRRAEREARLALAEQQAAAEGVITLPTVPGTLSEIQPQLAQIVEKISRIPFDAIGRDVQETFSSAKSTLGNADRAVTRLTPEAMKAVEELQATLGKAQQSIDNLDRNLLNETAPLQRQTEQALAEVQRAAQSLRVLADYLQRNPQSLIRGKPADEPLSTSAPRLPSSLTRPPMPTADPSAPPR
ncbi:intermembrane transport protein PqiB [Piscinibacter sakaiensis]|uniref:PqiB family protein n=1 Tax=Piscinibacter sakaiensis TaxID=1547922 RepID=UPI003AAE7E59